MPRIYTKQDQVAFVSPLWRTLQTAYESMECPMIAWEVLLVGRFGLPKVEIFRVVRF